MKAKTKAAQLVLRKPADGLANLTIEYRDTQDKFKRISTRIKVVPRLWDASTNTIRAKGSADPTTDTKTAREKLAHVNAVISELERTLKRMPTVGELSVALEAAAAPVADTSLLVPALEQWIAAPRPGKEWAPNTVKNFKTLLNNLNAYQTAKKTVLRFDAFNNAAVTDWQQWLMTTYNYKNSVLGKRVRLLKQFLNEASEGYTVNVKLSKIKPLHANETRPPFTLLLEEIEALRTLETGSQRLDRVRDLFTLQAYTGVRFSDLCKLNHQHVSFSKHVINLRQQKTGDTASVPLFPEARAIFEKYRDSATGEIHLPQISLQKQNDYLKELAQLLPQFDEEIYVEEFRGNKTERVKYHKWEMMSSHIARYSFITVCLSLGFAAHEVKQWSGHRTFAAFERYVGAAKITAATVKKFAEAKARALQQ